MHHNSLTDPLVRCLPNELFSEILEMSVTPRDPEDLFAEDRPKSWYSDITTPRLLEKVSKAWQLVVSSTPRLWLHVRFEIYASDVLGLDDTNDSDWEAYKSTFKQEVLRSGSLPLNIIFRITANPSRSLPDGLFQPLITLLNSQSDRWSSLFLEAPPRLLERIVGRAGGPPAILRTLAVKADRYEWARVSSFRLREGYLPSPHWLKISHFRFRNILVDWSHLRYCFLSSLRDDILCDIVPLAPHLEWVICKDFTSTSSSILRRRPVVHLSLNEMSFDGFVLTILPYLTFPALRSLRILRCYSDDSLITFLKNVSEHLLFLHLEPSFYDSDSTYQLTDAFSSLSALVTLIYTEDTFNSEWIFEYLSGEVRQKEGVAFLPSLVTFKYSCENRVHETFWKLIPPLVLSMKDGSARPLDLVEIAAPLGRARRKSGFWTSVIPEDIVEHIDHLLHDAQPRGAGGELRYYLKIRNTSYNSDGLKASRRYHAEVKAQSATLRLLEKLPFALC